MKLETTPDFIVIDDDFINNHICSKYIEITIPHAFVQTFTEPEKGIEYLESTYTGSDAKNAVLFLDINMPSLTGWDVLDRIKKFPDLVKKHIKIFMLSSSVDPTDAEKASNNPLVSGYIQKSLSPDKLLALFPQYAK